MTAAESQQKPVRRAGNSEGGSSTPVPPEDPLVQPRYAGWTTFARLPRLEDVTAAAAAVVGIPFDSAVTYRPGARFGPNAIREASRLLRPYNPAVDIDPFGRAQTADAGDIPCNPFDIAEAVGQIERGIFDLVSRGTRPVVLGGDHSVALPTLRALHAFHGPLALVHFDAHLDTWDTYYGAAITHGTPFRRAFEEGLLLPDASIHVGTRGSLYHPDDLVDDATMAFDIIRCSDIDRDGLGAVISRINQRVNSAPTYISVDIDVLDPAHAPGTGTPEAGGMTSRELLEVIRSFVDVDVIGADVVEVLRSS
jgi:agmatinase